MNEEFSDGEWLIFVEGRLKFRHMAVILRIVEIWILKDAFKMKDVKNIKFYCQVVLITCKSTFFKSFYPQKKPEQDNFHQITMKLSIKANKN